MYTFKCREKSQRKKKSMRRIKRIFIDYTKLFFSFFVKGLKHITLNKLG